MADFVKDSINQAAGNPDDRKKPSKTQILTQEEAKKLELEIGPEAFQKMIQDNIIAIKNILQKNNKTSEESKKIFNDILKSIKIDIYKKMSDSLNFQNLNQKANFENSLSSTFNSIKNFGNELKGLSGTIGKLGSVLSFIIPAIDQGIKNAIFLEKNQIETNKRYLSIRGISSLNQGSFFGNKQNNFERMVEDIGKTPYKTYSTEETWNTLMNMGKYYNTAQLNATELYQRGRDTLRLNNINPALSDIYNQMFAKGQGNRNQIMSSLDMYLYKFEKNSLGLDKSLQQTKQLQDINSKYGFTINQAAGYINKFNEQLQKGTLSLQDLTILPQTLQNASMAQNAGLGQEMLNAGFGTKRLRQAAGNPILTAAIMRNAGDEELEAMQNYFKFLMNSTGFTGTPEERAEMLGFMFQNRAGINLNKEQKNILAKGGTITAKSLQAKNYNKVSNTDIDYSLLESTLIAAEKNLTSTTDNISEDLNKVKDNIKTTLNELNKSFGDLASDILQGNASIKSMTKQLKDAGNAVFKFRSNLGNSNNIKNALEIGDIQ